MIRLDEIAEIRTGHGFRGAVVPSEYAESRVIQIRDLDQQKGIDWAGAERCEIPGRRDPEWLKAGDVIFQARGRKNVAVCLTQVPYEQVVCTQHFFIIRVHDQRFSPSFIAWQLNQENARRHFDLHTEDANTRHITLATIAATPVVLATKDKQQKLERLASLTREERSIFEAMMAIREQQMTAIANQIFEVGGNK